jgi:anthranilate phosphoribosyltransferase
MDQTALKEFGAKIDRLIRGKDLAEEVAYAMFRAVLLNEQPDLQQGAFLAALAAKGETVEELAGAWRAIYEVDTVHASDDLPKPLFENSGTGMDAMKTFNASSAAAIVAAAAGVRIARHGARAITSICGAVDILEAVGINPECDIQTVEQSIIKAGIGLFNGMSPKVHPGGLGRILSQIRFGSTLNIAASLAHPCRPSLGLRGVYSETILDKVANTMRLVGYERGLVVFGKDDETKAGMDELSVCGETLAVEFSGNRRSKITFAPEDAGLQRSKKEDILSTGNIRNEADRFMQVLSGKKYSACIDFTCLNAGAILYTAGECKDLKTGVERSREIIESGRAIQKLQEWAAVQRKNAADSTN